MWSQCVIAHRVWQRRGERGGGNSCVVEGVGKMRLWKENGVLGASIFDCLGKKDGMVFEKGVVEEAGGVVNLEEMIAE